LRIALIANPHASRVSSRQRDRVVAVLAARHKLELLQTSHPGHATELAARAVADGAEVVAVLGGDGTVNEVVNGLRDADAALALLGGGRVNVLARGLGLPASPDRATTRLLELLAAGTRRRVSLGVAGERCFALNAGLGLGGAIVREVERRQRAKQLYGDRAYWSERDRQLCEAAGIRYRVNRRGTPHHPSDLAQHECVILSDQRDWSFVTPAGPLTVRVGGRLATDNGEVIRDALLAGFGIALKSTWDVAPHLRSGELVTVLDSYPLGETVAIWAVYPSRAFVPPKTVAFIDFLAAHFGDPPYWDDELDRAAN